MKNFVVQSGPLRTFEGIYDPRFEKLRHVADYHAIEILGRPDTRRRVIAQLKRSSDLETRFVSGFFAAVARDHRTMVGLRDVHPGNASILVREFESQDRLRWASMKYGSSEDDLLIAELKDVAKDFSILEGLVPPQSGELFFYLTATPFDVVEVYWRRAAQASLKSREDRFRRDVVAFAHEARVSLHQDTMGSYTVVLHPQIRDVSEVEGHITAAGRNAGMTITFAPGLFG
jgi:hypothetical protein